MKHKQLRNTKSEIQEFRDRCSKAMGFIKKSWGNAGVHWHDPDTDRPMTGWKPDEDYSEAMMMRDRCDELTVGTDYADALADIVMEGFAVASPNHERFCIAFATARQIAEAALKCLEQK